MKVQKGEGGLQKRFCIMAEAKKEEGNAATRLR